MANATAHFRNMNRFINFEREVGCLSYSRNEEERVRVNSWILGGVVLEALDRYADWSPSQDVREMSSQIVSFLIREGWDRKQQRFFRSLIVDLNEEETVEAAAGEERGGEVAREGVRQQRRVQVPGHQGACIVYVGLLALEPVRTHVRIVEVGVALGVVLAAAAAAAAGGIEPRDPSGLLGRDAVGGPGRGRLEPVWERVVKLLLLACFEWNWKHGDAGLGRWMAGAGVVELEVEVEKSERVEDCSSSILRRDALFWCLILCH